MVFASVFALLSIVDLVFLSMVLALRALLEILGVRLLLWRLGWLRVRCVR